MCKLERSAVAIGLNLANGKAEQTRGFAWMRSEDARCHRVFEDADVDSAAKPP